LNFFLEEIAASFVGESCAEQRAIKWPDGMPDAGPNPMVPSEATLKSNESRETEAVFE